MTEKLLQFIWQLRHFNQQELYSVQGDALRIIYPGILNTNQGPDFLDGRVIIDSNFWAGSIELHLKTSDWKKHAHQFDDNYKNVILHVVWENDHPESELFNLPTLELQPRVSSFLLHKFQEMMQQEAFVSCEHNLHEVRAIVWTGWKERVLIERLQRKSEDIKALLQQNQYNWQETFWWLLARSFGLKVNADVFEEIARSIPAALLARHKYQIHQIEALLFGQAGLLNKTFQEDYPAMLRKEYEFLQKKYLLPKVNIPILFLRMRPPNFPSVRLAQLAMLITHSSHLFSVIKECNKLSDLVDLLTVTANDYWHYHYRFDERAAYRLKTLGKDMVYSILINTVVPILYCYGSYHKEYPLIEKVLDWMNALPAEHNIISKGWAKLGVEEKNAFDSQALLELKTNYCMHKRCLECSIGNTILRRFSHLVPLK